MPRPGLAVALAALVAGCAGAPSERQPPSEALGDAASELVVVAFVDSGINPYHEAFQRPVDEGALRQLLQQGGTAFTPIQLTTEGDYASRREADEAFWRTAERESLHWFRGTNVLAITFDPPTGGYPTPMLDEEFHGTAIASVLQQADPAVIMVSIQSAAAAPDNLPRGTMPPWLPRAFDWISTQPWIDAVFMSKGSPVNLEDPSYDDLVLATRAVAASGKVLVGSAGNTPGPHWTDSWQGPPWFVAVGGAENSTRGTDVLAAHTPDVVATYTNVVAEHDSVDGYFWSSGTSYGSPLVAGTLSKALRELRAAQGWPVHDTRLGLARDAAGQNITSHEAREALNATAVYWNTTDWDPLAYPAPPGVDTTVVSANAPVSPTPWVEMGWGYVGPELAPVLAEALAAGALSEKPAPAREHMAQVQQMREAYWEVRTTE